MFPFYIKNNLFKDRFDANIPVAQLKRNDQPKLIWRSDNRQTVGELFIGFLKFFAKDFRYKKKGHFNNIYDLKSYLDMKNMQSVSEWVV